MASLTDLENKVVQFVNAMKRANGWLSLLRQTQDNSSRTASDLSANGSPQQASSSWGALTITTTGLAVQSAEQTGSDPAARHKAGINGQMVTPAPTPAPARAKTRTPEEAQIEAFEEMRRQWLTWGEHVMRNLEMWLDREGLGIADRMTVVGLADRMGWYGIRMRVKGNG